MNYTAETQNQAGPDKPVSPPETGSHSGQGTHATPSRLYTPGRFRLAVIALALLAAIVVIGGGVMLVEREQETRRADTLNHVGTIALALSEMTRGTVRNLTPLLERAGVLAAAGRASPQSLRSLAGQMPPVAGLIVLNAEGAVLSSSTPVFPTGTTPLDSHPGSLAVAFAEASHGLGDGPSPLPALAIPAQGRPQLAFVIPTPQPSDAWTDDPAAWVVATVDSAPFRGLQLAAGLGEEGTFSLLRSDGLMLMRLPAGSGLEGRSFANGPLFRTILPSAPVGTSQAPTTTDGVARHVAHRALTDLPLVVTVGTAVDGGLPDSKGLLALLASLLVVIVTLGALVAVIHHQLRTVEGLHHAIHSSEDRFAAAFNGAFEGMLVVHETVVQKANAASLALTGRSRDSVVGQPLRQLFPEESYPTVAARLRAQDSRSVTATMERPDGSLVPVQVTSRSMQWEGAAARLLIILDISERRRVEDRLRELAAIDGLTECLNRRALLELAEIEFERFRRYGRTLSVLMIDADRFRDINDVHGHAAGDEVLCNVVRRCNELMRTSDAIGRYGGEEFVLVLPETPIAGATHVAERLRASIAAQPLVLSDGRHVAYTVSIGVAEARPEDSSLPDILNRADVAMHAAKEKGRNQVARSS